MKKIYLTVRGLGFNAVLVIALLLCTYTQTKAQTIFSENFNSRAIGQYDRNAVEAMFGVNFCKGADEGRVHVKSVAGRGNVLEVRYPQGKVKTGESGMHTKIPLGGSYDELYMSYWVYFPSDFEFRAGAKLPGLAYQTSSRNMSLRLMWRYNGLVEYYVHYNTKPTHPNYRASINWSLTDIVNEPQADQVKFKKGEWNHVELYNKMNTPGQNNGIMRGWLNGELAIDHTTNGDYRTSSEGDIKLNTIYWSTFFGGSDVNYQPTKDVKAYFDDIVVSRSRIGYPGGGSTGGGSTGGGSADNGPDGYTFAANEGGTVDVNGTVDIAYGANGQYSYLLNRSSDIVCNNSAMGGDPIPGVAKKCYTKPSAGGGGGDNTPITIESFDAQQSPNNATNLLDGDRGDNSRWSAKFFSKSVVFDLGSQKSITGFKMWTYQDRAYKYRVQTSNSPSSGFTTRADRTNNTSGAQPHAANFSANARYVRLTITGAHGYGGDWASINEVEIETSGSSRVGDDAEGEALLAYPNPNSDGIFNLTAPAQWTVTPASGGAVIASGEGSVVDLSGKAKGIYILKTADGKAHNLSIL